MMKHFFECTRSRFALASALTPLTPLSWGLLLLVGSCLLFGTFWLGGIVPGKTFSWLIAFLVSSYLVIELLIAPLLISLMRPAVCSRFTMPTDH